MLSDLPCGFNRGRSAARLGGRAFTAVEIGHSPSPPRLRRGRRLARDGGPTPAPGWCGWSFRKSSTTRFVSQIRVTRHETLEWRSPADLSDHPHTNVQSPLQLACSVKFAGVGCW